MTAAVPAVPFTARKKKDHSTRGRSEKELVAGDVLGAAADGEGIWLGRCSYEAIELWCLSRVQSRFVSPSKESKNVARCQSFQERPQAQLLPLPVLHPLRVTRTLTQCI
ncbi:hypothetical protein L2E82_44990 [Cichorium intybus]|uniref:Uncharacterized protein n=1 Tax=Cichorium intybus TaxID=13427 RepID=A0ACB8ZQV8_CICIN|nr:hypothetical protein L2E82_44990 [Cichorium intybus]